MPYNRLLELNNNFNNQYTLDNFYIYKSLLLKINKIKNLRVSPGMIICIEGEIISSIAFKYRKKKKF